MRRLHLVELEDLPWMPAPIRDGLTAFLQFAVDKSGLYQKVTERLEYVIIASGQLRVLDLCSGGGGAWLSLVNNCPSLLQNNINILLTDLYPNLAAFEELNFQTGGHISYHAEPVSATEVPESLVGFRTLFSSLHHFRPAEARAILADAVARRQPIAVFESTQRHLLVILYMLFTPILVLLSTPFIRPFRWSRLLFTYLIPIIPLVVMFDGIVSCLRTYTVKELTEMADSLGGDYHWEIGLERIGILPVGVTYLIGIPAESKNPGR